MKLDAECLKLLRCRYGAGEIVATFEMSADRQTGLSSGGTNKVEDLLIVSCLSWNWRERSFVKITERTYEKRTQALHR